MPIMNDEERLELAKRLDEELVELVNRFEKVSYADGWPEDRWEEEMDKHPFFMKKALDTDAELHPSAEALRQLKYDENVNSKEELANTYKEDGNFYFKHKKYRMAIYSFCEGLNLNCTDYILNATLYNNRSAAQFQLQNFRSSMIDAKKTLKIDPNYVKAEIRIAKCLMELKKFDKCSEICKNILKNYPDDQNIIDMLKKSDEELALSQERDKIKKQIDISKRTKLYRIFHQIRKRSIKFNNTSNFEEFCEEVTPQIAPLQDYPLNIDNDGILYWPVAFTYPEYLITEFQQELNENTKMIDIITQMLVTEKPDWDKSHSYTPDAINVYYEQFIDRKSYSCIINIEDTIKNIVSRNEFSVYFGYLHFYIFIKSSSAEEEFLKRSKLMQNGCNK